MNLSIDSGGTFTDIVIEQDGLFRTHKVPSDNLKPYLPVVTFLEKSKKRYQYFINGTTVATNSILQHRGAKTLLITTYGFKDVIKIKRQSRKDLYSLFPKQPTSFLAKIKVETIKERTEFDGTVSLEPSKKDIDIIKKKIIRNKIEVVAICLLNSFVNQKNEKNLKTSLTKLGIPIYISSELNQQIKEYERSVTISANAFVSKKLNEYINEVESTKYFDKFLIQQSNGGLAFTDLAMRNPVNLLQSGPAGGVIGAYKLSKVLKDNKVITYDMGGTSTDVSLIDFDILERDSLEIDNEFLNLNCMDISSIGSGGGSIAYIDKGNSLNVGPKSAGSNPGPSAYGKSNFPTVFDANIVLERIPKMILQDNMIKLYPERSYRSIERISKKLKISTLRCAESIIEQTNHKMSNAIESLCAKYGFDHREFVLYAYGGSSGLHACDISEILNIKKIVFPNHMAVFSAKGMLTADSFYDLHVTFKKNYNNLSYTDIEKEFESNIAKFNKINSKKVVRIDRFINLKYLGQGDYIQIKNSKNNLRNFTLEHYKRFGFRLARDVEVSSLKIRFHFQDNPSLDFVYRSKNKDALFRGEFSSGIVTKENMKNRKKYKSPLTIMDDKIPIIVNRGHNASLDAYGNIIIEKK
tara:strand:- start:1454 stop:3364 length:1911 start_codon:yes stop_codon:yes gene_type:complete